MPRVAIKKKDYLQTDLRKWMNGRMKSLGKTQAHMGELLHITQQGFGNRLKQGKFENVQLYVIFKELQATDEEILKLMKM